MLHIACYSGIQLLFAYPENHMEFLLVILFLSRHKFHAKQIVVLSTSMIYGPDEDPFNVLVISAQEYGTTLFSNTPRVNETLLVE